MISYLFMWLHEAEQHVLSSWKRTTRWSNAAHVTIDVRSRHRINPLPTRFLSGKADECRWRSRRYQVDPWSRSREVARGGLHSSPKPGKGSIFATGERSTTRTVCFPPTARGQVFSYQTPGRRPTRITGHVVNTVTRGWVGAPNECSPLKPHDVVVGFVDRCLSGTHNLAASISSPQMREKNS